MSNIDFMLCYLEEDNTRNAYFRIRPFLTSAGPVTEEETAQWPDEGCLRIVPDRKEQFQFKDRMRSLNNWCTVDLRFVSPDTQKIRPNKNYNPDQGETNQNIIYSDAVHQIPCNTIYQVLEGSDIRAMAERSITPRFYIRRQDGLYGPLSKAAPEEPADNALKDAVVHEVTCPDQCIRQFLYRDGEAVPQSQPTRRCAVRDNEAQAVREARTQTSSAPDTAASEADLSPTPARHELQRPAARNRTQEAVSGQMMSRYEPLSPALPPQLRMETVDNPLDHAIESVRNAWVHSEIRPRLIEQLLKLEGMDTLLKTRLCGCSDKSALQTLLKQKLQEMEAERLSLIVELESARAKTEAFTKACTEEHARSLQQEAAALAEKKQELDRSVDTLKQEAEALICRINELQESETRQRQSMAADGVWMLGQAPVLTVQGVPLRMVSVPGSDLSVREIVSHLLDGTPNEHNAETRNRISAWLLLIGICSRIGIATDTQPATAAVVSAMAEALGWGASFVQQTDPEQIPLRSTVIPNGTPCVLLTSLPRTAPLKGITKFIMTHSPAASIGWEGSPFPVIPWYHVPAEPIMLNAFDSPVSLASLQQAAQETVCTPDEVRAVLKDILYLTGFSAGNSFKELSAFTGAAAAVMEGGLSAALDMALLLWLIPWAKRYPEKVRQLLPLTIEYPHTNAALGCILS